MTESFTTKKKQNQISIAVNLDLASFLVFKSMLFNRISRKLMT